MKRLKAHDEVVADLVLSNLPPSLRSNTLENLNDWKECLNAHGFRTARVSSGNGDGLSVYKQAAIDMDNLPMAKRDGRNFLLGLFGLLHQQQIHLEREYITTYRETYCWKKYLKRLRQVLLCNENAELSKVVAHILDSAEEEMDQQVVISGQSAASKDSAIRACRQHLCDRLCASAEESTSNSVLLSIRPEQLEREYQQILLHFGTLSNVLWRKLLESHPALDKLVRHAIFRGNNNDATDRITITTATNDDDGNRYDGSFVWIPSLPTIVNGGGVNTVATQMVERVWSLLWQNGYYSFARDDGNDGEDTHGNQQQQLSPPSSLREKLSPSLHRYFVSGLQQSPHEPASLHAHFTPIWPLSLYLYGPAGTGKSSLLRHLPGVLQNVIAEFCDPIKRVAVVKQNLNKPMSQLTLELDLRPNNNDRSVMSIVQGRKCQYSQAKPGLVVLALEEMAAHQASPKGENQANDPNQLDTCLLLANRFDGRLSSTMKPGRRNEAQPKSGLNGDATIIPIFTSNYALGTESLQALKQLKMFSNLVSVEYTAIGCEERRRIGHAYLQQQLSHSDSDPQVDVPPLQLRIMQLDIAESDGGVDDIRPLIARLRMIAYWVRMAAQRVCLSQKEATAVKLLQVGVQQTGALARVWLESSEAALDFGKPPNVRLRMSPATIWEDPPAKLADPQFPPIKLDSFDLHNDAQQEINAVLHYWSTNVLCPAVFVCKNALLSRAILNHVEGPRVPTLSVNASTYHIMKSLYDEKSDDIPNLRDDILMARSRGDGRVAVGIDCPTMDSQMLVRELVEDSPSMTAFSTERSALQKQGLIFCITVTGAISPELRSRASCIVSC